MSYRAGVGPGLLALGLTPGDPTVSCDGAGCDANIVFRNRPPAWFLDRKPKPGWTLSRTVNADGTVTRVDLCPIHRAKRSKRK